MIQSADSNAPLPGGAESPTAPSVPAQRFVLLSLEGFTQGMRLFSGLHLETDLGRRGVISSIFRENLLADFWSMSPICFLALRQEGVPLPEIKTCLFMLLAINETCTLVVILCWA